MPQLHFYVSNDLAEKIKQEALAVNVSISRYLANLVKHEISADWPEIFFDEVVGGWVGEPLERPPQGEPEIRETFDIEDGNVYVPS